MMPILQTEHLTKLYGKSRGVTDLSLTVREGEIFGFIGPNGAGKSTTIRALLGLISPTSGTATLFGEKTAAARPAVLRRVGYMPSEAMFYSGMRVSELLALSARLQGKDCTAMQRRLTDAFGLDTKRKVHELSLGNRKKVSIVCAFQHEPELYILDEPTSGLDPLMQKTFFDLLHERHAAGATVFLSSHVLPEIRRHCARAAIIREGRLMALDSVEALTAGSAKRIILRGVSAVPAGLSGVSGTVSAEDSVSFLYSGGTQELLRSLAPLPLSDISITELELEEIFMHYYEREAANT